MSLDALISRTRKTLATHLNSKHPLRSWPCGGWNRWAVYFSNQFVEYIGLERSIA